MKLLLTADWHLRSSAPENRTDNFLRTEIHKLKWLLELAEEEKAIILQAGDFFDRPMPSYTLLSHVIETILIHPNVEIYCVYGQHDLGYHVTRRNTGLNLLDKAGCVKVVDSASSPLQLPSRVDLYGCCWGEELPVPYKTKLKFKVLIMHRMLIGRKRLWRGQTEYDVARMFLRDHKFDLIVSGDNHHHFIDKVRKRYVVNPGSLTRLTTAQVNYEPKVVLFDTETREYEVEKVPIAPPESVFDLKSIEESRAVNKDLEAFVEGLSESSELEGLDFIKNLNAYMESNKVEEPVQEYIRRMVHGE